MTFTTLCKYYYYYYHYHHSLLLKAVVHYENKNYYIFKELKYTI